VTIDRQQGSDRRHGTQGGWRRRADVTTTNQHGVQVGADRRGAAWADTRHVLEPAVMRSQFESFERIEVQFFVNAFGQAMAEARHHRKQCDGIRGAAQSLELRPVSGADHFDDRRRDASPDVRQAIEAFHPFAIDEPHDFVGRQAADRVGGFAISGNSIGVGSLRVQQVRSFTQAIGKIERVRTGCGQSGSRDRGFCLCCSDSFHLPFVAPTRAAW